MAVFPSLARRSPETKEQKKKASHSRPFFPPSPRGDALHFEPTLFPSLSTLDSNTRQPQNRTKKRKRTDLLRARQPRARRPLGGGEQWPRRRPARHRGLPVPHQRRRRGAAPGPPRVPFPGTGTRRKREGERERERARARQGEKTEKAKATTFFFNRGGCAWRLVPLFGLSVSPRSPGSVAKLLQLNR